MLLGFRDMRTGQQIDDEQMDRHQQLTYLALKVGQQQLATTTSKYFLITKQIFSHHVQIVF